MRWRRGDARNTVPRGRRVGEDMGSLDEDAERAQLVAQSGSPHFATSVSGRSGTLRSAPHASPDAATRKEICIAHAPPALSWRLHHSSPGSAPSASSRVTRTSCRRAAVGTRVPKAGVVTAGWLHSASVASKLLLLHDPSLRASTPAACRSPGQDVTRDPGAARPRKTPASSSRARARAPSRETHENATIPPGAVLCP